MKKLLLLLIITILSTSSVFATLSKEKLSKEIILSRAQIRHEYKNGVEINKRIAKFFIINRNNTTKLKQIEQVYGEYLNNKKRKIFRKKANIVKNIYLRAILKLRY